MNREDGKRIEPLWSNSSLDQDQQLRGLSRISPISFPQGSCPQHPAHPGGTWPTSGSIWMMKPKMFEKVKVAEEDILGEGVQQQKEEWML